MHTPTPGPWKTCDDKINVYASDSDIAITNVEHICAAEYDTQTANARLIASAPNLYALAQEIARWPHVDGSHSLVDAARRIIAQVDGRTPTA